MTTVADAYPAHHDPNGTTWWRSGPARQDGWTSQRQYADPSYDTTTEENTVPAKTRNAPPEALTEDFEPAPRKTEWMGYPLPPATPRPKSSFNGWGWYKLPDPESGLPSAFARATTIADTLDDVRGLSKWKRRETAKRILELSRMDPDQVLSDQFDTTAAQALDALVTSLAEPKVGALDTVLDTIDNLMGGAAARELGECVHAWLEALDMGIVLLRDVPDMVRPHVDHARRVMAHRGLLVIPEYVERTVLNDQGEETVAGKVDRIVRILTTGDLAVLDVKTSKVDSFGYGWLTFGVQVGGVYSWATHVLALDGKSWEPMPEVREDFAILLHVPSDQPKQAQAITIDRLWGAETMVTSLEVRQRRKDAKVEVPKHALPAPSDTAIRYVEARNALSAVNSLDEGQAVYESFQDVWDDDLDQFGSAIAELL